MSQAETVNIPNSWEIQEIAQKHQGQLHPFVPSELLTMATEIATLTVKLQNACALYDKKLSAVKVEITRRNQDFDKATRAEARKKRAVKEREKTARSLKGQERKLFAATGMLPSELVDATFTALFEKLKAEGKIVLED